MIIFNHETLPTVSVAHFLYSATLLFSLWVLSEVSRTFMIPHPEKAHRGGEDAFLAHPKYKSDHSAYLWFQTESEDGIKLVLTQACSQRLFAPSTLFIIKLSYTFHF